MENKSKEVSAPEDVCTTQYFILMILFSGHELDSLYGAFCVHQLAVYVLVQLRS